MKTDNSGSPRLRLAMMAVAICALLVNCFVLVENIIWPENTRQDIVPYEKRFSNLCQLLPRRGVIGYISDDENKGDQDFIASRIFLAQYALSPIILVRSLDYSLVVGNFLDRTPDFDTYRKQGLIPLKDFGNGVVLFRRDFR